MTAFEHAQALVAEWDADLRVELPEHARLVDVHTHLGHDIDGTSGQVETDEGDEPAAGAFGVRERAVVRDRERRLAIVLVHAEDERGLESVSVEHSRELLVAPARPVDVVTEVGMDVDEPRVLGKLDPEVGVPLRDERLCALERRHRSSFSVSGPLLPKAR